MKMLSVFRIEIHLHFVVTIPYIWDVIMSCKMNIGFKDNKVISFERAGIGFVVCRVLSSVFYHVVSHRELWVRSQAFGEMWYGRFVEVISYCWPIRELISGHEGTLNLHESPINMHIYEKSLMKMLSVFRIEIHLHFVVTIPYIWDVIMSCKMHILFKDNEVILFYLILLQERRVAYWPK